MHRWPTYKPLMEWLTWAMGPGIGDGCAEYWCTESCAPFIRQAGGMPCRPYTDPSNTITTHRPGAGYWCPLLTWAAALGYTLTHNISYTVADSVNYENIHVSLWLNDHDSILERETDFMACISYTSVWSDLYWMLGTKITSVFLCYKLMKKKLVSHFGYTAKAKADVWFKSPKNMIINLKH